MSKYDADVAVVGLGAWGSSTLWRLAERGVDVIGVERYGVGHELGSTHGATRLFRVACLEHPGLVPLAQRSQVLWRELEVLSGTELLHQCGGLMIGAEDSEVIAGTLAAGAAHDLPLQRLTAAQVLERYPQFNDVHPDHVGVWDPQAGVARPEEGVRAAVSAAVALGATVLSDTRVLDVELVPDGVVLTTATRTLRVRQAVVTAGAWLDKLVPGLPLQARRTPMLWFTPKVDDGGYDLGAFPVFIHEPSDEIGLWGHGAAFGHGVKIGLEDKGGAFDDCDPDTVDRAIHSERDLAPVARYLERAFPGLVPEPEAAITCMITNSPDGQFVLGRPGGDPRLLVGGGCSGHGFKHAVGIGEALAQMTVGEPTFTDLAFTSVDRLPVPVA